MDSCLGMIPDIERDEMPIMRLEFAVSTMLLLGGCTERAWHEGVKIGSQNLMTSVP